MTENATVPTIEAEENVVGALLENANLYRNREAIGATARILEPWDFLGCLQSESPKRWTPRAQIYYAMLEAADPPNPVVVAHQLIKLEIFQNHHIPLMYHYMGCVGCTLDYLIYARIVRDYSVRRQIVYYTQKGDYERIRQLTDAKIHRGVEL